MTEAAVKNEQDIDAKCNCDDPFRVGYCPLHEPDKTDFPSHPEPQTAVIKPSDRNQDKKSMFVGFTFNCPECTEPAIMHMGDKGFNYCPNCGAKVTYDWE